jgi:hypothetical protein
MKKPKVEKKKIRMRGKARYDQEAVTMITNCILGNEVP